MIMKDLFFDSAKLIKRNLMVIQPLFFGVLIIMFAARPLFTRTSVDAGFLITAIIMILLISAFIAGWYNCVKYTVSLNNKIYNSAEEMQKEQVIIIKQFFPGVAEYFLSVTALLVIYIGTAWGLSYFIEILADKILISAAVPQNIVTVINSGNQQEIIKLLNSLNNTQIFAIIKSLGLTALIVFVFHYFVLWFGPALFYSSKNPLRAVFEGIKFLFKNPLQSLVILFMMILANMFITVLTMIFGTGLLSFIPFLCLFFYILYYITTVFLYYEQKTENNCVNGSKLDREV